MQDPQNTQNPQNTNDANEILKAELILRNNEYKELRSKSPAQRTYRDHFRAYELHREMVFLIDLREKLCPGHNPDSFYHTRDQMEAAAEHNRQSFLEALGE